MTGICVEDMVVRIKNLEDEARIYAAELDYLQETILRMSRDFRELQQRLSNRSPLNRTLYAGDVVGR